MAGAIAINGGSKDKNVLNKGILNREKKTTCQVELCSIKEAATEP